MDLNEALTKKRILIVDDEPVLLESIKIRLTAAGYLVLTASNGLDAVTKVRAEQPDLIILDILMPKMDGYETCRLIKFDKRYKDIPVIMLSAKTQDVDRKMGLEVGANQYMFKPFDSAELIATIKRLIKE